MEFVNSVAKNVVTVGAALTMLGGFYSGVITMSGGRVIPWLTPTEVAAMVDVQLAGLRADADRRECRDYQDRLRRARAQLRRDPENEVAEDLRSAAIAAISKIPSCDSR